MRERILASAVTLLSFTSLVLLLSVGPIGQPHVELQVTSSTAGSSQLFFADSENAFTEQESERQALVKGANTLRFPFGWIGGTLGDFQRWDPSDAPGEFAVSSFELRSLLLSEELSLEILQPSVGVSAITVSSTGARFAAESNDSQILFSTNLSTFFQRNLLVISLTSLGISLLITLIFMAARRAWLRASNAHTSLSHWMSHDQNYRVILIATRLGVVALISWVVLQFGWLSDDALITIRTALNTATGYGPVFNIDERVQAFTHPLWFAGVLTLGLLTGQWIVMPILLGVFLTAMAVLVVAMNVFAISRLVVLALALLLSNAFVEYATSGLENSLSYVLVAILIVSINRFLASRSTGWVLIAGFTAALILLNRLDLLLLILPLLLFLVWETRNSLRSLAALLGATALPLFMWWVFSLFFFGSIFPSTFAAKTNVEIPRPELVLSGVRYLVVSFGEDPVSQLILVVGAVLAVWAGGKVSKLTVLGALIYLLYVVWVGGDFMSGRFLAVPVFAIVSVLAMERPDAFVALVRGPADKVDSVRGRDLAAALSAAAAAAGLFLAGINNSIVLSPDTAESERWDFRSAGGIADERGYHVADGRGVWNYFGSLRRVTTPFVREQGTGTQIRNRDLVQLQAAAAQWPRDVTVDAVYTRCGRLGEYALLAGPAAHYVDPCGLTDAFLASIPYSSRDFEWRPGHFEREIPEGYLEAIATGSPSSVTDEDTRADLEKLWATIRP